MMRTRQVSLAALATAAALSWTTLPAAAQSNAPDPAASAVPPPVDTNWPPTAPPLDLKPAAPLAETKTEAAASIELPPPPMTVPHTAPTVDVPAKPAIAVFALEKDLLARLKADKSDAAKADRDAATKFYDTRNGVPVWVTADGFTDAAIALMTEIKNADSYGLQATAFRLPTQKWASGAAPSASDLADAEVTLTLAVLKYARHARGGRLDPQSLTAMFDRKPQVYAPDTVLKELATTKKPADYVRSFHPAHPQFERLRLKYVAVRSGQSVLPPPPAPAPEPVVEATPGKKAAAKKPSGPPPQPTSAQLEKKLLANMEMWRWMPDMGDTFVHNNIPEFMTRLYRGGKLVHAERIVTGKADTPTPIFSDEFELVVFKPFWNVPESIKWKELQPQLERSGGGALEKAGLRAAYNGKDIDPRTVNWSQTDLRAFHVFQPPGTGNALGQVKFLFPNKHDVYMHDTPQKSLFNNAARAYSHGCMRVRDPLKFAELLLGPDKGYDAATIRKLANDGPENNEIRLGKKLPIHITYFTTWVDDEGTLKLFSDVYKHEVKIHLGLEGKAHLIEQPQIVAEKAPPRRTGAVVASQSSASSSSKSSGTPFENWMKNVFNF
jgi:L,D-transpeptidase YcbB